MQLAPRNTVPEVPMPETIRLADFTEANITPTYLGWLNDPVLMQHSRNKGRLHTPETARAYLKSMRDAGNPFYAVFEYDRHIGNIAAYIDPENVIADLTILIGFPHAGFGGLAWSMAIDRVFEETDVRKIEAGCRGFNQGMRRILEKTMTLEGRRVKHFSCGAPLNRNGGEDLLEFGLLRDDWEQAKHDARGLP